MTHPYPSLYSNKTSGVPEELTREFTINSMFAGNVKLMSFPGDEGDAPQK